MKQAVHRFEQGIRALLAFARSPDLDLAKQYLSGCEFKAFLSMSRSEQLHSLAVLRIILSADAAAPNALTAAALLHDVGKSRFHLAVWQKTLSVLVKTFVPPLNRVLSRDEQATFWRAPFTVRQHHPKWSGEILRNCGSDPTVIWLAERHQEDADLHREHPRYALLIRLQRADSAS